MKIPARLSADSAWQCVFADVEAVAAWLRADAHAATLRVSNSLPRTLPALAIDDELDAYATCRWAGEPDAAASASQCVAVLDPVSLRADLRDVYVQQWPLADLDDDDSDAMTTAINALLAQDTDSRLRGCRWHAAAGGRWYLLHDDAQALDLETVLPMQVQGRALRDFPWYGDDAPLVKRLATEIQMTLHALPSNARRTARGLPAANGVWPVAARPLPQQRSGLNVALASDDAFLRGVWQRHGAPLARAPDAATAGAVGASLRPDGALGARLEALAAGHISRLFIACLDGELVLQRARFWQRWRQRGSA